MKNSLIVIFVALFLVNCAGGLKRTSGGLEDVGYISLIGDPKKYQAGVLVYVGGEKPVIVEVVKENQVTKNDYRLKVPTGKHEVKMMYEGKVVYQQQMIFFAQETKQISLQ